MDAVVETRASGIWRFWPLRLVLFFPLLVTAYAFAQLALLFGQKRIPFPGSTALIVVAGIAFNIAFYCLLVRWMERRWPRELAPRGAPLVLTGAVIGAALFASVIAILSSAHGASINGYSGPRGLAAAAAMPLLAGVCEELIFRGAVFRLLEEGFGTLVAVVANAAIFGLIHAGNPGATPASTVAIALEAGVLLALAYTATRSLWLPIGIHFGWNFTEGGVFGAAVSGHGETGAILTRFHGPAWLTGGAFGPEASIPAVVVCLVTALALLVLTLRRGAWRGFRLRLATSDENKSVLAPSIAAP